jgi:hypothetical protein
MVHVEVGVTKRIKFHELNNFDRLLSEITSKFGARLFTIDTSRRMQARSEAIEFLRKNGFNVDDKLEWVTWERPQDYTLSMLKWA